MGKTVRRAKAFLGGVLKGAAAPSDVHVSNGYPYPHASEQEAMRQDWYRVGDGLKAAMKQSDGKATASSSR